MSISLVCRYTLSLLTASNTSLKNVRVMRKFGDVIFFFNPRAVDLLCVGGGLYDVVKGAISCLINLGIGVSLQPLHSTSCRTLAYPLAFSLAERNLDLQYLKQCHSLSGRCLHLLLRFLALVGTLLSVSGSWVLFVVFFWVCTCRKKANRWLLRPLKTMRCSNRFVYLDCPSCG